MVRRSVVIGASVILGLAIAGTTNAASIPFTQKVETDFPSTDKNVLITPTQAVIPATLPAWMTSAGYTSGMDFKDVRVSYDKASDTLSVGVNFKGIGGDNDGNGVVGTIDPRGQNLGNFEPTRFSSLQTVALGMDLNQDGKYDLTVGIPLSKPLDPATGKPMDGVAAFSLTKYIDSANGLPTAFGPTQVGSVNLLDHVGQKALETSADKPGIEFQITKFSEVAKAFDPKYDPTTTSLTLRGYSADLGSPSIGKSTLYWAFNTPLAEVIVPEPATLVAWSSALAALAAWRHTRRRASAR